MGQPKRATIYFEPELHKALKLKAANIESSVSELVNDAVKSLLFEDAEDIKAFEERKSESTVSFDTFVKKLKADGKL